MTEWEGVADALAKVLRQNGVGGRAFNSALEIYDDKKASDAKAKAAWAKEKCECACAHPRGEPCERDYGRCFTPCGVGY